MSLGGALPPHDSITERVFFAVAVFVRDLPAPRAFCIVWCDNRRHRAFRVLAAPDGVSLLPSRSDLPATFHTIKAPSTTICTWSYVSDVSYYVGVTECGSTLLCVVPRRVCLTVLNRLMWNASRRMFSSFQLRSRHQLAHLCPRHIPPMCDNCNFDDKSYRVCVIALSAASEGCRTLCVRVWSCHVRSFV